MASNVIAYIGNEHSDILLYLSRILLILGKKVLVIDHSEHKSLLSSVPQPVGIDVNSEIVTYLQVDFTAMEINNNLMDAYDDIFISKGYQKNYCDLTLCNRIVLVTDLHRYNHDSLRQFIEKCHGIEGAIYSILIRNNVDTTLSLERIVNKINISVENNDITVINRNDLDYMNSLLCHYNNSFSFVRISRQLQEYLKREVCRLYPRIATKDIDAAYRIARKGC